jgi:hypothetical protein
VTGIILRSVQPATKEGTAMQGLTAGRLPELTALDEFE